jgi:hypothetical protein
LIQGGFPRPSACAPHLRAQVGGALGCEGLCPRGRRAGRRVLVCHHADAAGRHAGDVKRQQAWRGVGAVVFHRFGAGGCRAGQGRAGQGRAGQGRAGQGRVRGEGQWVMSRGRARATGRKRCRLAKAGAAWGAPRAVRGCASRASQRGASSRAESATRDGGHPPRAGRCSPISCINTLSGTINHDFFAPAGAYGRHDRRSGLRDGQPGRPGGPSPHPDASRAAGIPESPPRLRAGMLGE